MYLFSGTSFLNSAPAKVDKGAEVDPCLLRHPSPTTKAEVEDAEVDECLLSSTTIVKEDDEVDEAPRIYFGIPVYFGGLVCFGVSLFRVTCLPQIVCIVRVA